MHSAILGMTSRLDELCARHDRTAAHLHCLGHADFERASCALRRFVHLRDLMRLRLFAAGCVCPSKCSAVHEGLRAQWPPLLRAYERFEALVDSSPGDLRAL